MASNANYNVVMLLGILVSSLQFTLQFPDLLRTLTVVPPLWVQGALKKQELLLQLGLLPVRCTAPLLQLAVQALQLAHWLGHLCVALPQSRCSVRLCTQEVIGLPQLSVKTEKSRRGTQSLMYCPSHLIGAFVLAVYLILQLDYFVIWGLWVLADLSHIFKLLL